MGGASLAIRSPQQTPRSPAVPNGWLLSPFQIGRWGACDLLAVATSIATVGHTDGEHCSMFRSDVIRSGTSCAAKHRAACRFHARRSMTAYRPSPHFPARGGSASPPCCESDTMQPKIGLTAKRSCPGVEPTPKSASRRRSKDDKKRGWFFSPF
jgi:hypothetical protein